MNLDEIISPVLAYEFIVISLTGVFQELWLTICVCYFTCFHCMFKCNILHSNFPWDNKVFLIEMN